MKRRPGRPHKYTAVIELLDDDTLYTAASISYLAEKEALLTGDSPQEIEKSRDRVRIAMGRLSHNHAFPAKAHGYLKLPGQEPARAWYGRLWKEAYDKPYY